MIDADVNDCIHVIPWFLFGRLTDTMFFMKQFQDPWSQVGLPLQEEGWNSTQVRWLQREVARDCQGPTQEIEGPV